MKTSDSGASPRSTNEVDRKLSTSEILNKAADAIEERGWAIGGDGWNSRAREPLCLEGGIQAALDMQWSTITVEQQLSLDGFKICPAYKAVQEYLELKEDPITQSGHELWRWNDNQAEDEAHVIRVLRAAALIEVSKEEAFEGVLVT